MNCENPRQVLECASLLALWRKYGLPTAINLNHSAGQCIQSSD